MNLYILIFTEDINFNKATNFMSKSSTKSSYYNLKMCHMIGVEFLVLIDDMSEDAHYLRILIDNLFDSEKIIYNLYQN